MAYLDLKGEGNNSMPENRWLVQAHGPVHREALRDMAKAGLPES